MLRVIFRFQKEAVWINCSLVGAGGTHQSLFTGWHSYLPDTVSIDSHELPNGPLLQKIALGWWEPPGLTSHVLTPRDAPQQMTDKGSIIFLASR